MKSTEWWQQGVIYQIWVRSFYDTDGDGNGDLAGIIAKLDYLQWLGVDILWLSPIFPSPWHESGYDITDYTAIHPMYGDLQTFDRLVRELHQRGMRLLLDFVPNHTSDSHPWFVEARASRESPKRDWYIWADPKEDGSPPSNWVSAFGGSAWNYDAATKQYYEHAFLPQQPDLNWRNPEVQQAILETMRLWMERGADGFRMDAIWHLIKDEKLRDNPANPDYTPDLPPDNAVLPKYTRDRPEVHQVIQQMRKAVDRFPERILAGELYLDTKKMMAYYGTASAPELHLPLNMQLSILPWEAMAIGDYIKDYMGALPEQGWANWALSTHDAKRIASKAGERGARLAALMLLTLPGTPIIYYGDEIGLPSVDIPRQQIQDMRELRLPYLELGRDHARTPMRWNPGPYGDFSSAEPWLPIGDQLEQISVQTQSERPDSMLSLYRQLIELRKKTSALQQDSFRLIQHNKNLIVYERGQGAQRLLIALNFSWQPQAVELTGKGSILLSSRPERTQGELKQVIELQPEEGLIIAL